MVVSPDAQVCQKIQSICGAEKLDCYLVSYGEHLKDLTKRQNPFMLVVDFSAEGSDWIMKHLSEIKVDRSHIAIIGLVAEGLEADIVRLQRAGCDHVLKKEKFFERAEALILRYIR